MVVVPPLSNMSEYGDIGKMNMYRNLAESTKRPDVFPKRLTLSELHNIYKEAKKDPETFTFTQVKGLLICNKFPFFKWGNFVFWNWEKFGKEK